LNIPEEALMQDASCHYRHICICLSGQISTSTFCTCGFPDLLFYTECKNPFSLSGGQAKQVFNSTELQKGMEGDNSELNKKEVEEMLKLMLLGFVNDPFEF
jgi:hypothetical protein